MPSVTFYSGFLLNLNMYEYYFLRDAVHSVLGGSCQLTCSKTHSMSKYDGNIFNSL